MGILTEDMKRVVREQKLVFIATVCPDGRQICRLKEQLG
jgi:hypothetical protein